MKKSGKRLSLLLVLFTAIGTRLLASSVKDDMLQAYADGHSNRALRLSRQLKSIPESKYINAMCKLHDPRKRDVASAFKELKDLCDDSSIPDDIWLQCALSYARAAQLMARRENIFPQARGIDFGATYSAILKRAPNSEEACETIIYSTEDDFESGDPQKIDAAFKRLEAFCSTFAGPASLLTPIHLYVSFQYIARKHDYNSSVKHLVAADKQGLSSPRFKELTLFRIGRIFDHELHNRENALGFYKKYLEEYPNSRYSPVVRRYMREMNKKQ